MDSKKLFLFLFKNMSKQAFYVSFSKSFSLIGVGRTSSSPKQTLLKRGQSHVG